MPYDGPGVGGVELLASAASSSRVMSSAASSSSDGIGAEGSKALAGVKILQDVQEELVEKPVLLRGEKEGLVHIRIMIQQKWMNLKKTGDGGGQCVPKRSKSFCWLGCTRVWSTVVTPSASDSFFSKEPWIGNYH